MARLPAVLLPLLASCWHAGATTSPGGSTVPAGMHAPLGAPPTVEWTDNGIATHGLPAIAGDGSVIQIGELASDGGRGNPNLTLYTLSRDDHPADRAVIVDVEKSADLGAPERMQAVASANRRLADANQALHLVPLTAFPEPAHEGEPGADTLTADGIAITWDGEKKLVVTVDGKQVIARDTPEAWLVKPYPMYNGAPPEETCHNPARLGGGAYDRARRAAVIYVRYHGNDSCWEPTDQIHVLTW